MAEKKVKVDLPGQPGQVDAVEVGVSDSYLLIALPVMRPLLATEPPVENWLKFQRLVEQWQTERGAMSSLTEAVLCPSYQSIIGLGESALPFIFAKLRSEGDEPDQWFWALKAITGADPVRPGDRGNYPRMSAAWLEWASNQPA